MIELKQVRKQYGKHVVIRDADWICREGRIYGLVGYNGSGKTTLLKTMAGIYRADGGEILADGVPTWDNEEFLRHSFLMTEELFFDIQSTPDQMRKLYKGYYPGWSDRVYEQLLAIFGLDGGSRIAGFSKGMQRQTGLLLALATQPRYLFLDETFDGLDVTKRKILAEILRQYADKKQAVIIVTSHYLNELETVVDEVGMIEDVNLITPDTKQGGLQDYFLEKGAVDRNAIAELFN